MTSGPPRYDRIGTSYGQRRIADPRIGATIHDALGDATTVINVGAGTGSYEPVDRVVIAVEPSEVMLAQRPEGAAPVVQGVAEALPFPDRRFDAAMAILNLHHWSDRRRGLGELRRVAAGRVVVLTWDVRVSEEANWLLAEYMPGQIDVDRHWWTPFDQLAEVLGEVRIEVVQVPHDCTDGFFGAYWRRPEAYLDPVVQATISNLAMADPAELAAGMDRLRADLESGAWHRRHADLLDLDEYDVGYRLVVATR